MRVCVYVSTCCYELPGSSHHLNQVSNQIDVVCIMAVPIRRLFPTMLKLATTVVQITSASSQAPSAPNHTNLSQELTESAVSI